MNEIQLYKDLGDELEQAPPPSLARQRQRLLKQARPRRWRMRTALAIGAATAVAVGVFAVYDEPEPAAASAAMVLEKAARAVGEEAPPKPDEWVFSHERMWGVAKENRWEAMGWQAVPGGKPGMSLHRIPDGWEQWSCVKLPRHPKATKIGEPVKCLEDEDSEPGYKDDLPTSTDAVWRYLRTHPERGEAPKWAGILDVATSLMTGPAISPKSQATLFRALKRIPDIKVVHNAKTRSERDAIALVYENKRPGGELVGSERIYFDPATYRFLGYSTEEVVPEGETNPYPNTWDHEILQRAYVDKRGEFP